MINETAALKLKSFQAARPPEDRATFCHAPSLNLNFEQNGNVTACCYNRKQVLGRWPEQSIGQIWNGKAARELREALKSGDLSKGCDICLEQYEAGNYQGMRSRHFDGPSLRLSGARRRDRSVPRILEFELSNACNLECEMCNGYFSSAIRKNREKLPPHDRPYDRRFVEEVKGFLPHLDWARFLGGEPFLNPLYYEIWDALAECNAEVNVAITTNGTILNDRVKQVLAKLRPDLVVSMDSLEPQEFERIRKGADFEKVRANLEWFMEYARKARRWVSIAVCPMRSNWREIPRLVMFSNFQEALVAFNTVLWPLDLSLKSMSRAELDEVHEYLVSQSAGLAGPWGGSRTAAGNLRAYQDLIRQVESWRQAQ